MWQVFKPDVPHYIHLLFDSANMFFFCFFFVLKLTAMFGTTSRFIAALFKT